MDFEEECKDALRSAFNIKDESCFDVYYFKHMIKAFEIMREKQLSKVRLAVENLKELTGDIVPDEYNLEGLGYPYVVDYYKLKQELGL